MDCTLTKDPTETCVENFTLVRMSMAVLFVNLTLLPMSFYVILGRFNPESNVIDL